MVVSGTSSSIYRIDWRPWASERYSVYLADENGMRVGVTRTKRAALRMLANFKRASRR
jgi:hypothetical protein